MLARSDLRGFTGDLVAAVAHPVPAVGEGFDADTIVASVREIIAAVRSRGDAALREYTEAFDGAVLDDLRVPDDEVRAASEAIDADLRSALEYAAAEIRAYHEAQAAPEVALARDGVRLRELVLPVGRVGCYVPGGRASYPSTVLMTAIPARVAGVTDVALTVPPDADGRVPTATLAAAALVGVTDVYRVGGAQAIAALAYGTETIRPVDVVVGPGNAFVTAAKHEVSATVGIDMLAGPSEIVVVADDSAVADLVAVDLLAQAEHGPDGAPAVLVTWHEPLVAAVDDAMRVLVDDAPRRADIETAVATGGRAFLVDGPEQAMAVANAIAPEHLELMTVDPEALVPLVRNAGAVFCGAWAPAVLGDYVAGTNHVLPTAGAARYSSALRVDDFRKHVHVVTVDEPALRRLAPYVRAFAEVEGLAEHGRSVTLREQREDGT